MTASRAMLLWLVVAVVASVAFAGWAAGRWSDAADASAAAVADVAEVERLRAQILAGRAGGNADRVAAADAADVSRSLSDALAAAGVEPDHIAQVGSPEARPVAGAPLVVERRSAVALRDVTLAQAVALVAALDGRAGLSVRDLRLAAPSRRGEDDLWDLDLTLSTLASRPVPTRGGGNASSADVGMP